MDYDKTVARVQAVVDSYPGVFRDVQTYLRERTKEVLTGSSDAIVVRIYGDNLQVLQDKGKEIKDTVAAIQGTKDAHLEFEEDVPQIEVQVDLAKVQASGLKPGDIRRAASTLIGGEEVGTVFKDGRTVDVWVWGTPANRSSVASVQDLLIDTPAGSQVRLGDVARVEVKPAPNVIRHEGGFRRLDVGTNVAGRDLGAVARDVQLAVNKVQLPLGYRAEVLGEYAERQQAQRSITLYGLVAALGILLLLRISFHRWRLAFLAFFTLPIALVGGLLAAFFFSGASISLGSLVGFFTVLGIVARNGIMMISHYHHLESEEGMEFGPGPRHPRGSGAAGPHLDDRVGHRPGPRAAGAPRQHPRPGDRVPAGHRDPGRPLQPRRCSTCSSCRRSTSVSGSPRPSGGRSTRAGPVPRTSRRGPTMQRMPATASRAARLLSREPVQPVLVPSAGPAGGT